MGDHGRTLTGFTLWLASTTTVHYTCCQKRRHCSYRARKTKRTCPTATRSFAPRQRINLHRCPLPCPVCNHLLLLPHTQQRHPLLHQRWIHSKQRMNHGIPQTGTSTTTQTPRAVPIDGKCLRVHDKLIHADLTDCSQGPTLKLRTTTTIGTSLDLLDSVLGSTHSVAMTWIATFAPRDASKVPSTSITAEAPFATIFTKCARYAATFQFRDRMRKDKSNPTSFV